MNEDEWYELRESVASVFLEAVAQATCSLLWSFDEAERERLLDELRHLLDNSLSEGLSYLKSRGMNTGRDDDGSRLASELDEMRRFELLYLSHFQKRPPRRTAPPHPEGH